MNDPEPPAAVVKQVPEGSVPVGASCPTCHGDLVAPPDVDGAAWCPNEECPEKDLGFIRSLMLPLRRPKRTAIVRSSGGGSALDHLTVPLEKVLEVAADHLDGTTWSPFAEGGEVPGSLPAGHPAEVPPEGLPRRREARRHP